MVSKRSRARESSSSRIVRARPGADRWSRLSRWVAELWARALEVRWVWFGIFVIAAVLCLLPAGSLSSNPWGAGEIAPADAVASRDLEVVDVSATETRRREARSRVLPVYDLDDALATQLERRLAELFQFGREMVRRQGGVSPTALVQAYASRADLALSEPAAEVLLRERFSARLEESLRGVLLEMLQRGIVADKARLLTHRDDGIRIRSLATGEETTQVDLFDYIGYPDELQSVLEAEARSWAGWTGESRAALVTFLLDQLQPNLLLNRRETLAREEAAAQSIDPVTTTVRRGQVIVRQGDRIGPTEAAALALSRGTVARLGLLLPALGGLLLASLTALVLWLGPPARSRTAGKSRSRLFSELLLVLTAAVVGTRFLLLVARALADALQTAPFGDRQSWYYAIPFASLAIIAELLYGRRHALLLLLGYTLPAAVMTGFDVGLWTVGYTLVGSLTAMHVFERTAYLTRTAILRTGLAVAAAQLVWMFLWTALQGGAASGVVLFEGACALGSGLLAAAVASFGIPVLEVLFGITTDIKLVELANTNLPLLQRLALEAPGTFQHSLMVANLAKAGTAAIEADAVLAYTGGLYHDIGKLSRPEYFVENQRGGANPHDSLAPTMSAMVVISHVKDGVQVARRHHLPQPVIDAIEQHHGTRRLTYFYNRALESSDPESRRMSDEKFRYPGPRPRSRVMGVLMLADGVEAASRTLTDPSPARLRSVVRAIVDDCLQDRQLEESELTLADLRRVSEAFLSLLANVHHRRLDYPGFVFETPSRPGQAPRPAGTAGT